MYIQDVIHTWVQYYHTPVVEMGKCGTCTRYSSSSTTPYLILVTWCLVSATWIELYQVQVLPEYAYIIPRIIYAMALKMYDM